MTAPMLMSQHPTEETLAAFVDDRLDSATRLAVTDHLASCGDCREIVMMAAEFQRSEAPANVRQGTFGPRRWLAAAGLAAAAAIAFVLVQPSWLFGPDVEDLVVAAREMRVRPGAGRFAGGFAHHEEALRLRGGTGNASEEDLARGAQIYAIHADLEQEKRPDPHVLGLARLLAASTEEDVHAAVDTLRDAHTNARAEERDDIAVDLAAGLLQRFRWTSSPADPEEALALSNQVLSRKRSPEALWNRAAALESLNRAEAVAAWDDYLKADSKSDWAGEARMRRNRIVVNRP